MAVLYGMFEQHWTILSAFAILCVAFWYYWSHWKVLQAAWRFPNVGFLPALPIVGHGYLALRGTDWVMNYVSEAIKKLVSKGCFDKMIYWCGPYPVFFLFDPQEIQMVLNSTKTLERGLTRKLLKCFLGDGLISASVDVWKVTRRHVNVMFRPRNLELVFPKLNEVGRDLVSGLADHLHSGLFDVEPVVDPFSMKSSCVLIFPQEVKFDVNSTTFRNALEVITWGSQIFFKRFVTPYMWPDSIFMLLYKNCFKHIDDTVDTLIHEANKESSKHTKNEYHDRDHTDTKTQIRVTLEDVYKTLHQNYPSFTEQYYKYEAINIVSGGTESTRVTLSSCLLALAAKPNIQEKLYSEIVSVTGPQDSDVTPEDIRAMPYLDQVLKETLRFFNVIPLIPKKVHEDLKLRGWTAPKGSQLVLSTVGVHFNPQLYPEPERFDPDRFSPENVAARGKNSFIPFSGGPRNCIGKNYSMMALKIFLIHVVKKFKFSTTEDINFKTFKAGVVFSLKDGYKVEIELRNCIL